MKGRMSQWAISAALCASVGGAANAQGGPPPTPVRVDGVQSESIVPRRLVTGELRVARQSIVAAREPGLVVEFPCREAQTVKAGDVLVRLDTDRLDLQLAQIDADRAVADAIKTERTADLAKLDREIVRIRRSLTEGAGTPLELDDALDDRTVLIARLSNAGRSLDVITARQNILEDRIADMTVAAPFDGVILSTRTEVGEWIGEGGPVVEIIAIDEIEAWMNVPQEYFSSVQATQEPITLELEGTRESLSATESRVLPQVDRQGRSFSLVVSLSNPDRSLAPGMSVIGWIPTAGRREYLTVSKGAVLQRDAGSFVYVVRHTDENKPPIASPERIEVLFPYQDRFVIRAPGLSTGDSVIVEGNERLMPMSPLQVVNDGEDADTP